MPRALAVLAGAFCVAAMFAACETYIEDTSNLADGGPEAASPGPVEAGVDADLRDGALDAADAVDAADAGSDADSGADEARDAACATPCDCDEDGYYRAGCDAGVADAGSIDCDDFDSRTHPGAGFLTAAPAPPRNGDWDCDGTVTRAVAEDVQCERTNTNCPAVAGFTTTVACGDAGTFIRCKAPVLLGGNCAVDTTGTQVQACR